MLFSVNQQKKECCKNMQICLLNGFSWVIRGFLLKKKRVLMLTATSLFSRQSDLVGRYDRAGAPLENWVESRKLFMKLRHGRVEEASQSSQASLLSVSCCSHTFPKMDMGHVSTCFMILVNEDVTLMFIVCQSKSLFVPSLSRKTKIFKVEF